MDNPSTRPPGAPYRVCLPARAKGKRRRRKADRYEDLCMLPTGTVEPILFFGGRDYIALFCELTAETNAPRTVFYAGRRPDVSGCSLREFGRPFTNWHYQCARAFAEGSIQV